MFQLSIRRLLQAIPTLWIIATLTFILMQLTPGGPFDQEKPVTPEIKKLMGYIRNSSKEFNNVSFSFEEAGDGFRKCLGITKTKAGLSTELVKLRHDKWELTVKASNAIFGPQPFLALKTRNGQYFWQNFDFKDHSTWTFVFDQEHAPIDLVEKIGVACNSPSGVSEVNVIDVKKDLEQFDK